ncbi:MAG: stage II sporulation protein E [Anaerocolumna aminovalerica]|uniref:stage II sporulation protein E n=1 Tax=Anaerocolumna aminovalerica TaxID=1527 RepID=UPI002906C1F0|nr:stage II sporulation protein E [Anaerocolumna aminovalerica]MDU6263544.1 stage II sporulation protein E [Anaerocolumna aminovalerica]
MKEISMRKIIVNLMGVMIGRAVFAGINPIGIAFFTAVYIDKKGRLAILISVLLGMATVYPVTEVVKYSIVMAVIAIIVILLEYSNKRLPIGAVAGVSGGVTMFMSIANGLLKVNAKDYILMGIAEGIAIFALTFIFRKGVEAIVFSTKGQALDNEQIISIAVILAAFIYGIPNVGVLDFSLTLTAALFSILLIGYKYGAGYGAIAGAACGIILALKDGQINQIGLMCMLGIIAGTFRELGRLFTIAVYSVGVFFLSDLYQNYKFDLNSLGALVSTAAIFLLMPKSLLLKIDLARDESQEDVFVKQNIQNIARGKLKDFSSSFHNLSDTFTSITEKKGKLSKKDKSELFDELTEQLCKDCTNCDTCWKTNFYETYQGAHHIMEEVDKNGTIAVSEVPVDFAGRCIQLERYVVEARRVLEVAKLNLAWNNRLAESREAIAGQLNEVANIIDDFSMDLYKTSDTSEGMQKRIIYQLKEYHIIVSRMAILEKRNNKQEIFMIARTEKGRCITTKEAAQLVGDAFGKRMRPADGCKNVLTKEFETFVFVEDADYKVFTGMAKMTKDGGRISGDNFSFLYPDSGMVVMTLADGMGTGETAFEESEYVVDLLEQFIEAGFRKESAINLINSILVLKAEEQSFSTIDMTVINLFTGVCDIIKIGASTTFIKRSKEVETINSNTLPVGVINHMDYETISRKLSDGDFVVMVTDGVIDCIPGEEKEQFLEEFISELRMNNPQEIANAVLNQALELNGWVPKDDMTVLAAGFWKKLN